MTAEEYLELLYPRLFDETDPTFVSMDKREKFLVMAQSYRPYCLSEEAQNEAQAHYAAYLAGGVATHKSTEPAGGVVSGPVVRERQGTSEVEYAKATDTGPSATGPLSAYSRWAALKALCGKGAILAGNAFPPIGPR